MIEFEVCGRVAVIRASAGRLNIYSRAMHQALCRAMLRFLRDDTLHAAVMTSAPGQSWSVGDDVKELDLPWGDEPDWAEVLLLLPRDKPVVAAVRGYCLGQGLVNLLRLTDVRFAAPDAVIGFPEIGFGLGGAGVLAGLDREIPPVVARHLALTGENLTGEAAARLLLVNETVTDDQLDARAMEVAQAIAKHPLAGLRAEMSPVARSIGARNPYHQVAQLQALWPSLNEAMQGTKGAPTA